MSSTCSPIKNMVQMTSDKKSRELEAKGAENSQETFLKSAYALKDKLLAVALIRLRNTDEAEDAVSEAILKANAKKAQLKDQTKLLSWLVRIVINHCYDLLRKKKKLGHVKKESEGFQITDKTARPEEKVEMAQEIERILDVLLSIKPDEHRDVLIYYYYRKFSLQEIAEMLDVAEGTVKSRLSRARPTLTKALKDAGIGKAELMFVKDLENWPLT